MPSSSTSGSSLTCWPPRRKHPAHADRACARWSTQTQSHACALVHGDVSPKNILVGPPAGAGSSRQPVLLDAECAWWGDPAFDLAFVLEPPAAEVPVDAGRARGFPAVLRCAGRQLLRAGGLGAARRPSSVARRRCCPGCCWRGWTASRRSNTSPRTRSASVVRRAAGALLHDAPARVRDVSDAWREQLVRHDEQPPKPERDPLRARPPRVGQPRPPHGRGRGAAGRRRGRPRDRARGCQQGHARGARAARRRPCARRPRRAARRRAGQRRHRARGDGHGRQRPGRARRAADRARRHAQQVQARRQRHARGVDGRRARRGGGARRAAVPVPRRARCHAAADAAGAGVRRRRARRPAHRHPGLHGRVPRCQDVRAGDRVDGRGLPPRRAC